MTNTQLLRLAVFFFLLVLGLFLITSRFDMPVLAPVAFGYGVLIGLFDAALKRRLG